MIPQDKLVFAAELFPYRSLGHGGFRLLLLIVGAACCVNAVLFLVTGAWPVSFFFGLDFVLLYVAFRANYRSARMREHITVSPTDVSVRKISAAGEVIEHRFNPFWTRFWVRRHDEIGIVSMHLSAQGQQVDIGAFLNPDDRESFAKAFQKALATARQKI